MYTKSHILLGAVFALMLYFVFHFSIASSLIVFLSSVLIDIDHYLFYAIGKRDFSLKNSYNWFVNLKKRFKELPKGTRKKYSFGFTPLHSIEFLVPLFILGLLNGFFLLIFIGFFFHVFFDMLYEIFISKIAVYKISVIYTALNKRFIGF